GVYNGTLGVRDLDLWSFTACLGDNLVLRMDEATNGSPLTPWIRLYGRDGTLLNTVAGAGTAQISRTAPASGNYTVVLGDFSGGYAGSGGYTLTLNGPSGGLKVCVPRIAGTNFMLGGVGGTPSATFILSTATNLGPSPALWTPLVTNQFDAFGAFAYTNLFNRTELQRYF